MDIKIAMNIRPPKTAWPLSRTSQAACLHEKARAASARGTQAGLAPCLAQPAFHGPVSRPPKTPLPHGLIGLGAIKPIAKRSRQPHVPLCFREQIKGPENASIARFDGLGCY